MGRHFHLQRPRNASWWHFFFFFFCHMCTTSPHSNFTIPSEASGPLCDTRNVPERHPGFEQGTPGYPQPHDGADGKALSSLGSPGMLLTGAFFCFFILCHRSPICPPSNLTFPSGSFCPFWSIPSGPEIHPSFEPYTSGSPGPSSWTDGKALSSMVEPGMLLSGAIFFFFFSTGAPLPPPHSLPFPQRPFAHFGIPLANPRHTLYSN